MKFNAIIPELTFEDIERTKVSPQFSGVYPNPSLKC